MKVYPPIAAAIPTAAADTRGSRRTTRRSYLRAARRRVSDRLPDFRQSPDRPDATTAAEADFDESLDVFAARRIGLVGRTFRATMLTLGSAMLSARVMSRLRRCFEYESREPKQAELNTRDPCRRRRRGEGVDIEGLAIVTHPDSIARGACLPPVAPATTPTASVEATSKRT